MTLRNLGFFYFFAFFPENYCKWVFFGFLLLGIKMAVDLKLHKNVCPIIGEKTQQPFCVRI